MEEESSDVASTARHGVDGWRRGRCSRLGMATSGGRWSEDALGESVGSRRRGLARGRRGGGWLSGGRRPGLRGYGVVRCCMAGGGEERLRIVHVSAASVLLARICETRGVSPMAPGSSTDPRALPIALEGPSTSSTAPTLGSGAATMRAEQPTDLMVTAVAMKGMVAADRTASGDTVLTHMHTFERHVLRGEWSLVVQENSPNVFVAKDGSVACDEYHDVEDLFARQLFQDENGERYLVRIRDGAPDWQPMATLMSRHRRARMTMHIDNTSASLAFDVYVFNRPRLANARVFWPLTTLYGFIGHKSFDHAPAHWMSKSWARWAARLTSACGSSQLVVGTYVAADRPRKHKCRSRTGACRSRASPPSACSIC